MMSPTPVHDVEDSIATGAFDPIVLADPKMLDHIIEQTRAWYGAKWDADKLLAAFMRLRREHLFPAHFQWFARIVGTAQEHYVRFDRSLLLVGGNRHARHVWARPLTRYSANIVIPEDTNYEIVALKGIAVYFVMAPREREPFHQEELKIVSDLVDVLMADSPLPSDALESQFLADWNESTNDNERLRVAIDQVASLTDNSALALHSILC